MAYSKISFIRAQGGLGRQSISRDGDSGLVVFSDELVSNSFVVFSANELADYDIEYADGTNGVESSIYYHVEEYFKFSSSPLYIALEPAKDFTKISDLQRKFDGTIRQLGVLDYTSDWNTTDIQGIQTEFVNIGLEYRPMTGFYSAGLGSSGLTIATLPDLNIETAFKVGVLVAEDLAVDSKAVQTRVGSGLDFVGCIGNALGMTSSKLVSDSIGEVGTSNLKTTQWSNPGFIDGSTRVVEQEPSFLETLANKQYTYVTKYVGDSGAFFNSDATAVKASSDYGRIAYNRVYDKAQRLLYVAYLPYLNSKSRVDGDGLLADDTVTFFETVGNQALAQMVKDEEIGNYLVNVDPNQQILQTSKLEITVILEPFGLNKEIEITLGFGLTNQ